MADGSLNFDTKIDESGFNKGLSTVEGAFGKVGGLFKKAGVAIGGLAAAGTGAFTAITKSALDGVAQLEQNIGGVETLFTNEFGSAADAVIENANRAYETAGMSANDYMSTVTSFSASLLQAVGNDTAEAAKVADMAIIDMSDNANKMGSNMQDIQNAYQGFAKQNYTMLDNLKLGYGGTKTEMERLLSDAEKLSGVKYDISNLSDVYNAIHVIQDELGIANATREEAATTIEGSLNSAKAAWDNFMAGTGSVDEMAEAFGTAAEVIVDNLGQIIPRLTETLPALIDAVSQQLPKLTETLLPALVTGGTSLLSSFAKIFPSLLSSLGSVAPVLFDAVQGLMSQLLDAVTSFDFTGAAQNIVDGITNFINGDALGQLLNTAAQIISALADGIAQALPTLIPAAVQLMAYITQTLIENISTLIPAALQLIQGLADGIIAALPVLVAALPEIINTIITTLTDNLPLIIDMAVNVILSLVDGIIQALPQLAAAIPQIIQALVAALPDIITSIVTTLTNALPQVLDAAITLLMALIQAIPEIVVVLAENLPQIITAIADGLAQATPQIFTAAKDLLWQIIEAVPEIVSGLATAVPDIISGIVNGLLGGLGAVKDAALELGGSILSGIKSFFGINSPSTVMTEQGDYLVQGLINGISEMPGMLADTLADTLARVTEWGQQMLNAAKTAIQTMISNIVSLLSELPGKIWTWLVDVVTKVTTWQQQMVNTAKTAIDEMISGIISLLTQLPGKVQNELAKVTSCMMSWGSDIVGKMTEVGSNIVSGIWNGISSGWSWLKDKVAELASSLLDAAKDALGINSPSKEFRDKFGRFLMPGAVEGVKKSLPAALKNMKESAAKLITAMKSTLDAQLRAYTVNASSAADRMALVGGGSVTYVDHGFKQENTYNVPVATPSEVNKAQREAFRKMAGGVK